MESALTDARGSLLNAFNNSGFGFGFVTSDRQDSDEGGIRRSAARWDGLHTAREKSLGLGAFSRAGRDS